MFMNEFESHPETQGELMSDSNGVSFVRKELSEGWVSYQYLNPDGSPGKHVAMPRLETFTAEDIERYDEIFAAEDTAA